MTRLTLTVVLLLDSDVQRFWIFGILLFFFNHMIETFLNKWWRDSSRYSQTGGVFLHFFRSFVSSCDLLQGLIVNMLDCYAALIDSDTLITEPVLQGEH